MANLTFKRGLLANLPGTLADGAVYITTDERAMYTDYNDGGTLKRIRIGDVIVEKTIEDIQARGTPYPGALCYSTDSNVLMTYKEGVGSTPGTWVQINAQKTLSQIISEFKLVNSAVVENSKTVGAQVTINLKGVNDTTNHSVNFQLKSNDTDALAIEPTGSVIKIGAASRTDTAKFGVVGASNSATLSVSTESTTKGPLAEAASPASTHDKHDVIIAGTNGNTVSVLDNTITIAGTPVSKVTHLFDNNGVLSTAVESGPSKVTSNSITPTIYYGVGTDPLTKLKVKSAVFAGGNADLDVYTRAEVDTEINKAKKAVNAMVFKGTVGSDTSATLQELPKTAAIGDTYKVYNGTVTYASGKTAKKGDLLIAIGKNNAAEVDGLLPQADLEWAYVPSGDEAKYSIARDDTAITFNEDGSPINRIAKGYGLTYTVNESTKTVTIGHKVIHSNTDHPEGTGAETATTAATIAAGTTPTFTVVDNIKTDELGHVDTVTLKSYTIDRNTVTGLTSTVVGTTASNTAAINLTLKQSAGGEKTLSDMVKLTSHNLAVKVSEKTVAIDFEWGTF